MDFKHFCIYIARKQETLGQPYSFLQEGQNKIYLIKFDFFSHVHIKDDHERMFNVSVLLLLGNICHFYNKCAV